MNASHTERLVAFARTHETTTDVALALGVLLLSLRMPWPSSPIPSRSWASARRSHCRSCGGADRRCGRSPRWPPSRVRSGSPTQGAGDAALLIALYTVAAHEPHRARAGNRRRSSSGPYWRRSRWGSDDAFKTFVGLSGLTLAAAGLGTSVRQRHAYQASLEERAAAAERARIAREMHDIVAHNLSVMIALADGAAFAGRAHPAQAASAMRDGVRDRAPGARRDAPAARRAARRRATAELAPQPGLGDLDQLRRRRCGPPGSRSTLEVAGDAPDALPPARS